MELERGISIMTKMFLTSLNTNIKKSLNPKERFLDDSIIVGYIGVLILVLIFLLLYGVVQYNTVLILLSLFLVSPLFIFNIVFHKTFAPKYRLSLQRKYLELYYKERYYLCGSVQQLNSQSFKIKTFLSRSYSFTCIVNIYIDKLPESLNDGENLVILLKTKKDEIEYNNVDYLVYYDISENELSINTIQEKLDDTKKQNVFGKFYSAIVIEAYIDRILSEFSKNGRR